MLTQPRNTALKMQKERLAYNLLALGFRPPIVQSATNINVVQLRSWYKEIHHCSPPHGAMRESSTNLATPKLFVEATLSFHIYLCLAGTQKSRNEVDFFALCNTIPLYRAKREHLNLAPCKEFTASDVYALARDYRSGSVELAECRCGATYPTVPEQIRPSLMIAHDVMTQCPACHMAKYWK